MLLPILELLAPFCDGLAKSFYEKCNIVVLPRRRAGSKLRKSIFHVSLVVRRVLTEDVNSGLGVNLFVGSSLERSSPDGWTANPDGQAIEVVDNIGDLEHPLLKLKSGLFFLAVVVLVFRIVRGAIIAEVCRVCLLFIG